MKKVLILGGTGDAVKLAAKLATIPELEIISSLAGRTKKPAALVGQVRIGGFGGMQGLASYLSANCIDYVIDATHPCAGQITQNAAIATQQAQVPFLMLVRPQWEQVDGDRWIEVATVEAAAQAIPESIKRVFITSGRQQLEPFLERSRRSATWYLIRAIDPPEIVLPHSHIILDRGPFSFESERQLLQQYQIEIIVSKNSGGAATYAKLQAARELQIPIVMVQRPSLPDGDKVSSCEDVLVCLERQLY